MKKANGYYIDENNNRWDCNLYTEDQAKKNSESLIDCSYCYRCSYCSDCSDCSDCSGCSGCSYCSDCSDCSYCYRCSGCSGCSGCSNCSYCSGCSDCSNCSYCSGYKSNPERYCKELIGTITKLAQAYWLSGDDLQIVFGCYKTESLEDFKAKAIEMNGKKKAKPFIEFADVIKQLTNKKQRDEKS